MKDRDSWTEYPFKGLQKCIIVIDQCLPTLIDGQSKKRQKRGYIKNSFERRR